MVWTKEQAKEYYKEYRLKNKEQIKEYRKKYYSKNKEREKKQMREYILKNRRQRKEYMKEYNKEYRLKNKEWMNKQMREYYSKNKEQRKEYNSKLENIERRRNWTKNRYRTNVNFKLLTICRARLLAALKGKSKSASTIKLLGCTIEELRRHIESKFEPWMTWENHGLWDVDHIKACFHFNLVDPEQQRACFNWSNLQPMEHIANIKKGVG